MTVICTQCRITNSSKNKYCRGCGAAITTDSAQDLERTMAAKRAPNPIDEPAVQAEGPALQIPPPFINVVAPGTILKLTPLASPGGGQTTHAIHLVSRKMLKLGRTITDGFFPTYFLPRSKENDEQSRRLGHWHCSLELRDENIWVVDNHATNLTYLDRMLISEAPFLGRAIIGLAHSYFIEAMPFESTHPKGPVISNIEAWAGPPDQHSNFPFGSVRLTPVSCEQVVHDAVWLFTDGTFGTGRNNPIVIAATGLGEVQGRFHYWRGCFWLENSLNNNAIRVNGSELNSNGIVPMAGGQTIHFGSMAFLVDVVG